MKIIWTICLALTLFSCSQSNSQKTTGSRDVEVGGRCEGCEAIFESPVAFDRLPSTDTLPGFSEKGEKIRISGIVYRQDGKTPAANTVLYLYHTDQNGNYATKGNETGWGKRHGYIRAWLKTDAKGAYSFYTLRPASYPNSNNPQHIHVTIKEEGKSPYWIDDFHFADDVLLTEGMKKSMQDRGGSGIIALKPGNGLMEAQRNIILGKNVPGYPAD